MGNCSLLLEDNVRAREEFVISGLYIRALQRELVDRWNDLEKSWQFNAGVYLKWGFYVTILSGDSRLVDAVATDIRTMSDDFKAEYGGQWGSSGSYWRTCTLAALYQGDDDAASDYLALYPDEDDAPMTHRLVAVHEAMLAADEAGTRAVLTDLADDHDDMLGDSRPWKAAFSHTASAHLLVARSRGMDITAAQLDSDAVPLALDEYDIGDNIDLPAPEYVDQDLIPE